MSDSVAPGTPSDFDPHHVDPDEFADLHREFLSLRPTVSRDAIVLHAEFFEAFLDELGDARLVELLVQAGPVLADLPLEDALTPIEHPTIGEDASLEPEGPLLARAFQVTTLYLALSLGRRWKPKRVNGRWERTDPKCGVPTWLIYGFLEIARQYRAHTDPEDLAKHARARIFLGECGADLRGAWALTMPFYATEKVVLAARSYERAETETRKEFMRRILVDTASRSLRQVVPQARRMDEFVEAVGLPYPENVFAGDLAKRARQCVEYVMGRQMRYGGRDQEILEELLSTLGFISPDPLRDDATTV